MFVADQNHRAFDLFVQLGCCNSLVAARNRGVLTELDNSPIAQSAGVAVASPSEARARDVADHGYRAINDDKLIALFKGLVLADAHFGWREQLRVKLDELRNRDARASLFRALRRPAAVSVFREIERRFDESRQREIADWAIAHRRNEYIPFGLRSCDSFDEYKRFDARRSFSRRRRVQQPYSWGIGRFIELGRCNTLDNPACRAVLDKLGRNGASSKRIFQHIGIVFLNLHLPRSSANSRVDEDFEAQFNDEELIALFKGVVLAESYFDGWRHGSVAPGIWVFWAIDRRLKACADRRSANHEDYMEQLSQWAVANSNNPWIPLGSSVRHSYKYDKWYHSPEAVAERNRREAMEMAAAKERREQRRRAYDRMRDESQKRRAKDVNEICNVSALDGVVRMTNDKDDKGFYRFSLAHYPLKWAQITDAELATLPTATLQQIARRARQRAPTNDWRMMAARISRVLNARAT